MTKMIITVKINSVNFNININEYNDTQNNENLLQINSNTLRILTGKKHSNKTPALTRSMNIDI